MTTKEKEERDLDYMYPIILLGWGLPFLFGSVALVCLFVMDPYDPYDWRLWFSVILGLIVGIWWTQSGIRQIVTLWKRRTIG